MIIKLTDLEKTAGKIRGRKKPQPVTGYARFSLKNPCGSCFCQAR